MVVSVDKILNTLEKAINAFQNKIPAIQKIIFDELQPIVKQLQTRNGMLINNLENLKYILDLKNKLEKIIITADYKSDVKDFINSFDQVGALNVKYFQQFNQKYTPPETLRIVKQMAVETTINDLVGQGLQQSVIEPVKEILRENITSGGNYAKFMDELRTHILTDPQGEGKLERYTKQITVDAIHQYNAQYHETIAQDLNFTWGRYVGSNIETSREFCILLTAKDYVNKVELPEIIKGHIDGEKCKLSGTTGLPLGMKPGTNAENFKVRRGGYTCHHQFFYVPDSAVPQAEKDKLAAKGLIQQPAKPAPPTPPTPEGIEKTIVGYRNKASKATGENGTFYNVKKPSFGEHNEVTLNFKKLLEIHNKDIADEGLPTTTLFYKWFKDVDPQQLAIKAGRKDKFDYGDLIDKMVVDEARKRGYDGIKFGDFEIIDLRTPPPAPPKVIDTTKQMDFGTVKKDFSHLDEVQEWFLNNPEPFKDSYTNTHFKTLRDNADAGNNGSTDLSGNISLSKPKAANVIAGLNNIKNGVDCTPVQEKAFATLWHEIWHNTNHATFSVQKTQTQIDYMEQGNEFVARSTLETFFEKLGTTLKDKTLLTNRDDTGYNTNVRNYIQAIKHFGADKDTVVKYMMGQMKTANYDAMKGPLKDAIKAGLPKGSKIKDSEITKAIVDSVNQPIDYFANRYPAK